VGQMFGCKSKSGETGNPAAVLVSCGVAAQFQLWTN